MLRWLALIAVLALSSAAGVLAHVRLINPSNGEKLYWPNSTDIGIVINSTGSDNISDDSDEIALRLAIREWNGATGSRVKLKEDTSSSQQSRTDWNSSGIHLIYFDEVNSSGYFPTGSGTVAITPIIFFGDGRIVDADIIFNGKGYSFTTSQQSGRFDVGDVATHELGHLIGLDHSAQAGSSMYPYVDPSVILHRSLTEDEESAMRLIAPDDSFGKIKGSIEYSSNGKDVEGAHVVARDAFGRTNASVLSRASGNFTLAGLLPGTYTVYAVPLGSGGLTAPVSEGNLGGGFDIDTDFRARFYADTVTISGGETESMGKLKVSPEVNLNLGTSSTRYPIRVTRGQSTTITLRGLGLNPSSTLEAADPAFTISSPNFLGSQVSFQLSVPSDAKLGSVDLMVTNLAGYISVLSGALEVTPPSPSVATLSPSAGSRNGGTLLTLTGTNFNSGARVVIGNNIYTDGQSGVQVLSPTTLSLTTKAAASGNFDVVVIDATGVEGRKTNGFTVNSAPVISSIFPLAGSMAGGTEVRITGQDFLAGSVVRVNGIDQGALTLEGSGLLCFTTLAGSPGGQVLELEGPDSMLATSVFSFAAQVDPVLDSITPASIKQAAGSMLTLSGSNFGANSQVWIDADPVTGVGGTRVDDLVVVDSGSIQIMTPKLSASGSTSVMVLDGITSQASMLSAGLNVTAPKKSGGGGGGCYMVPMDGGSGPRDVLLGTWWLLLVLGSLALRNQRVRGRALVPGV